MLTSVMLLAVLAIIVLIVFATLYFMGDEDAWLILVCFIVISFIAVNKQQAFEKEQMNCVPKVQQVQQGN